MTSALAAEAAWPGVVGAAQFGNLARGHEHMKHWWQGWSLAGCFLFGIFIILLTMLATALAKRANSSLVLIPVEIGGLLLIIWAGRIVFWNIRHIEDSRKKE